MMHRHTTLWRAVGVLAALVLCGLPASAARQHRAQRAARTVQKKSHRTANARGTYTVRKGDTLEAISKRLGVSQRALARANGLRNIHRLSINQVLKVPGKMPARQISRGSGNAREVNAARAKGSAIVQEALRYRGVPYRYAGMTSRGMDCSGLVARVLMTHGIRAPHHSASLAKLGVPVKYADLRSGDLVFFNTRGRGISHVGIYMGDNTFVHASSGSGCVVTSSLAEGYYRARLVCARRLTNS